MASYSQQTSTYVYGAVPYNSSREQKKEHKYAQEVFNEEEKAKNIVDTCDEPEDRDKPIDPVPPTTSEPEAPVAEQPSVPEADQSQEPTFENEAENGEQAQVPEEPVFGSAAPDPFAETQTDIEEGTPAPKNKTTRKVTSKKAKAETSGE